MENTCKIKKKTANRNEIKREQITTMENILNLGKRVTLNTKCLVTEVYSNKQNWNEIKNGRRKTNMVANLDVNNLKSKWEQQKRIDTDTCERKNETTDVNNLKTKMTKDK